MTQSIETRAHGPRADIVAFENVSFSFGGAKVYDRLSFTVAEGEFICILGPSGCGKSTSLRIIGDLLPYSEGTVRIAGLPPHEAWEHIAFVFQSPRLAPWRNALENVMLAAELRYGRGLRAERERKARELLALVGLEEDMHKFPSALSGGESQRVAIARALAVDPRIVLMDEPFSALDFNTRMRLRSELIDIWQKTGKTILFVTHDIEEALMLADRILVLSAKPTRLMETLSITEPRPRRIDASASLREQRSALQKLFETTARAAGQDSAAARDA